MFSEVSRMNKKHELPGVKGTVLTTAKSAVKPEDKYKMGFTGPIETSLHT